LAKENQFVFRTLRCHINNKLPVMDYKTFYAELFAPLEDRLGPIDRDTICAIVGFDAGGPLSFCTIGGKRDVRHVTYISCELAVRDEQRPSEHGRYEFICTCDDEEWVRSVISNLGRMSLETELGHGHTVDIGPLVRNDAPIQAVLITVEEQLEIAGERFAIHRATGITRDELNHAIDQDSESLLAVLRAHRFFPNTTINRASAV